MKTKINFSALHLSFHNQEDKTPKKEKDWRTEMGPYYFAISLHKQPWTLLSSE